MPSRRPSRVVAVRCPPLSLRPFAENAAALGHRCGAAAALASGDGFGHDVRQRVEGGGDAVTTLILLLVAAAGLAFFLWSPSWLGPPDDGPAPLGRDAGAGPDRGA